MLRQKVFYSGNVQGVGFRYAVASLAKQFPVEGWVRNLPDGRVELAVEGQPEVVRNLLAKISAEAPGRIKHKELQDWTAPNPQPGFQIRFDLNP
jgi:acylphosphatase